MMSFSPSTLGETGLSQEKSDVECRTDVKAAFTWKQADGRQQTAGDTSWSAREKTNSPTEWKDSKIKHPWRCADCVTTILCNFSSYTCSCEMQLFPFFYWKLDIKVKLLSMWQLFVWQLSRFAGCGKYNSGYHCSKLITFSLSRSVMFSPCMRHLRINVTSGCKFCHRGQHKAEIFSWHSLPASSNFTVPLSSTSMTSGLPSTVYRFHVNAA